MPSIVRSPTLSVATRNRRPGFVHRPKVGNGTGNSGELESGWGCTSTGCTPPVFRRGLPATISSSSSSSSRGLSSAAVGAATMISRLRRFLLWTHTRRRMREPPSSMAGAKGPARKPSPGTQPPNPSGGVRGEQGASSKRRKNRSPLHPPLGKTKLIALGPEAETRRRSPPASHPILSVAGLRRSEGENVNVLRRHIEHPAYTSHPEYPRFACGTFDWSTRANRGGAPEGTCEDDLGKGAKNHGRSGCCWQWSGEEKVDPLRNGYCLHPKSRKSRG